MRFLLLCTAKDLRRRLADPAALVGWVGIPLLVGLLIALIGGVFGTTPEVRLLLADGDDPLVRGLSAQSVPPELLDELPELLEVERVELEEGRLRMDRGEATAMLVVPEGFMEAVARREPATLTLVTNPAQRVFPALLCEGIEVLLEVTDVAQRIMGDELLEPGRSGASSDEVARAARSRVVARMAQRRDLLMPPVLTLEPEGGELAGVDDLAIFFFPGVLLMSLLFIGSGMGDDVWAERAGGTLRRALSAPRGVGPFLGGKLLAGTVIMGAVSLSALLLAVPLFDVPWWRVPGAALFGTFVGAALLCIFLLIHVHCPSQQSGRLASTVLLFPLLMLGGSFFPFPAMPDALAAVGRWTPNGIAVAELHRMLVGTAEPAGVLLAVVGIGLPAALAFTLAARRVRHRFGVG